MTAHRKHGGVLRNWTQMPRWAAHGMKSNTTWAGSPVVDGAAFLATLRPMSTVAEIEKAVAALPAGERRRLIAKLAGSPRKKPARKAAAEETTGAHTGPRASQTQAEGAAVGSYPPGHFERLVGSWADLEFELPSDNPPEAPPEWS